MVEVLGIKNLWNRIKLRYFLYKIQKATEPQKDGFKFLYKDSLGNKWYTVSNLSNIHASRALMGWVFQKDMEFGMSSEKRQILYAKMNEAVNKGDISTVAKLVGLLEAGENLYAETTILLNLVTCYTFLNDEKNDGYLEYVQDKKREIWSKDNDCKSFFLQFAVNFTEKFSKSQSKNVLDYLDKARPLINQISEVLKK